MNWNKKVLIHFSLGIDISYNSSTAATTISLEPSGVDPGLYGSNLESAQINVDQYGRITSAENIAITIPVESGTFEPTFSWVSGGGVEPITTHGYYFVNDGFVHGVIYAVNLDTTLTESSFTLTLPVEPSNNFDNLFDVIGVTTLDHGDAPNNTVVIISALPTSKLIRGIIKSEATLTIGVLSTTFAYEINN